VKTEWGDELIMIKKITVAIGILLVVFLVVYLIPLKTVAYTVMVDYQDTEPLSYEVIKVRGENVWLDCVSNSYWHYHFRCSPGT
jgi:hypothetical protein